MSMNLVVLKGRVTSDIEVKKTPNGVSVAKFNIAVDRPSFKKGEEKKTDFFPITVWRNTAEFVGKYFTKGQQIIVQGSIQTGSYEKDGIKRNTFEIVTENVDFCGSKSDSASTTNHAAPSFSNADTDDFVGIDADDDEELPF